jgi:oxygen-independent coproporphyrinogen-3 oxidase
VECAPGTLTPAVLEGFQRFGVNRVSLGVQSFVDAEAASVGRLHKRQTVLDDLNRLRSAGIANINIDLIAGLPHQTAASWSVSLAEAINSGAPHISVYMLEVDQDSRLGRELIAGGTRYHAHFVPDEDLTADLYVEACERLDAAGVRQYEISNFARQSCESRHNLKYWTRQPYVGFGVDAHSMLWATEGEFSGGAVAIRFASTDSLEGYLAGQPLTRTPVTHQAAMEEMFFLGLRLTRGVDLEEADARFGKEAVAGYSETISEFIETGLLQRSDSVIRLTPRGRLLSNEVFERFVSAAEGVG